MSMNTAIGAGNMGLSLLSSFTTALGSIFSGEAQQKMYDYQAGIARLNEAIAEQNSAYTVKVGELQAGQFGYKAAQQLGMIRAGQGSRGLDVNTGSNKQVQSSQELLSATEMTAIRSNAARTAYDYRVQATEFSAQSALNIYAGQNALAAGYLGATSSLIGGASAVSNEWLQGQRLRLWGASDSAGASSNSAGGMY